MKVLWFSNSVLSNTTSKGSGSWLFAMKNVIAGTVKLYNITNSTVDSIVKHETPELTEFIIPDYKLFDGVPSMENALIIQAIVNEISPDIIHIWGIEKYWARLYQRGYFHEYPVLLEIQGILSSCANTFYGGLFPKEIIGSYGFREFLKPLSRLNRLYDNFRERAKDESIIMGSFANISTQSSWTRRQIGFLTSQKCQIYETLRPIRKEFYESKKWEVTKHVSPVIYTSLSYSYPFKGLHVIIKAMSLVVKKYPQAKLVIAGFEGKRPFYKDSGYNRYIKSLIKHLKLTDCIILPGRLGTSEIVEHLLNTDVFINPSFVESYSAAAAEALYLGVPSVLSYAGALPNFSDNKKIALYYSPMDYVDCAAKILELFDNKSEALFLSSEAISEMRKRCSSEKVLETQITIYNAVLGNK